MMTDSLESKRRKKNCDKIVNKFVRNKKVFTKKNFVL